MTTRITGTIFGKPFDETLVDNRKEFSLGSDYKGNNIRIALTDSDRERLDWEILDKGIPSVKMETDRGEVSSIGRTGMITKRRITVTNPNRPENTFQASFEKGNRPMERR